MGRSEVITLSERKTFSTPLKSLLPLTPLKWLRRGKGRSSQKAKKYKNVLKNKNV